MSSIAQKPLFSEPVLSGLVSGKTNYRKDSPNKTETKFWDKAQSIAEWVCSRESTYRTALDLVGWELPSLLAASTRNIYSLAEAAFMSTLGFLSIVAAPNLTKLMGKFLSNFYLDKEDRRLASKFLLFQLNDLDDQATVEKSIERMKHEEPEDCSFMMDLNKDKPEKVDFYKKRAENLT